MSADAPRRGLGRGLSALMGEAAVEQPIDPAAPKAAGVRMMQIAHIQPNPHQPRRHFDETALDELAASIAARGLIQPIVVRPHPHNSAYQIVAGERRWRAAQRARLHDIPVIIRELSDADTVELAIVENVQRQDLNAIEEAEAYQKLIAEYGHTQEALGKLVGKSRSHVANLLRLLELPEPVRQLVVEGSLDMGHARALVGAPDAERIAREVAAKGLSVRDTERLAREAKPASTGKRREGDMRNADILALENRLGDVLGLNVRITFGAKGGALTLAYSTLDQLDMVCQRLSGERI